jgi:maltose alpha-D-glucosyltransferase / alpha-amylase
VKKLASATDPLWYKDAIIYEVHVRAFADSNNDGIGDFPGLMSRLDYLQDLGITCIWLLPFFPSPLRDDGYDISNYVDVNPSYGTLNDFKTFLDAAHQRNMQVMIELVINHTSDQHPWFKAARIAAPGSPQRDMYVWSQSDQKYKDARIIFTDTEKSNWTWDETAKAYYWHRFFSHQPDLNFDNLLVLEEVLKAMRFWLDMGVDALRMDAIPYLVERDGTSCENLPETHQVIKNIRASLDADYANRLILAEANQWPADVRPYFGDGDECHMAFHFPLMPRIYMALRQEDRLPITDIMAHTPPIPDNCQWGLFLRNHDELTLEMVTDDERDYMYFAYSADPRMRINVGIRRRLAPLVDNNRRRIELLNSLLLSFPGTPILYYGDELGMGDNIYLGDRNGVRTPMQWTSDRNAGFSKCDPARLYFPVVMDPIYGYQVINVEAQLADQSSLLHWTRNMIALRKLFQVFGRGTLSFLNPSNRKVLAYLRDFDRGDGSHETILCVANLSRFAQPVSLDLASYNGMEPVELLGYVPFPTITDSPYQLTLAPYSFLWLELQAATTETKPPLEPKLVAVEDTHGSEALAFDLVTAGWAGLLSGNALAQLESALPAWLLRQRWFGAKSRRIQSVRVLDWIDLSKAEDGVPASPTAGQIEAGNVLPALFFAEVTYFEGAPDIYQLPLAVSTGTGAEEVTANRADSIVTTFTSVGGPAILHDATAQEDFQQVLLALIESNTALALSTVFTPGLVGAASLAAPNDGETGTAEVSSTDAARVGAHAKIAPSLPVAPAPLDAQPGEAAVAPQSVDGSVVAAPPQRMKPRESPSAGDSVLPQGRLEAHASSAFDDAHIPRRLLSRVGSAEQSNTSILYGDKLILKLFRRLQPGENPDVEIGRFLTEVAHFRRIAPYYGEISILPISGEKTTVAMLQALVAHQGDGWEWYLEQLVGFYDRIAALPAPPDFPAPSFSGMRTSLPEALEPERLAIEAAALLGRRTAEMHQALSSRSDWPAFAPEPFTKEDLERDAQRIEKQVSSTLETLKSRLATLDDATTDAAALLLSRRRELMARSRSIAQTTAAGLRIRIHGDYHLGQTLRTGGASSNDHDLTRGLQLKGEVGDFVLLDFEGEPARPLEERRRKQSPLRDVAGMIRSFSYVAYAGLDQFLSAHRDNAQGVDPDRMEVWARLWQNCASAEFLYAYRETIAANEALLPSPEQAQTMLDAYLLEKALYELLYELNNRPAWLRIPIAGIVSL